MYKPTEDMKKPPTGTNGFVPKGTNWQGVNSSRATKDGCLNDREFPYGMTPKADLSNFTPLRMA